ncbi:MAG TPA: hypothetical protein VN958_21450 [Chitinophagaceae bacterium]|nr:hypothetical protein [Chitinophagaceae bacterium]
MFKNFYHEFSKKDKQIIRDLIDKGLQREFENGIKEIEKIIDDWKVNKEDRRKTYHRLYDSITDHRKHLARRYDGLGGSDFVPTTGYLLSDGIIKEEELAELSSEAKQLVITFSNIHNI